MSLSKNRHPLFRDMLYLNCMGRESNDLPPDEPDIDDGDAVEVGDSAEEGLFEDATPDALKSGMEIIRQFWQALPNGPGVYRMIGEGAEVLYVGKAKSLKKRVASYTREAGHANRITRMIALTRTMEFVTTETETEALLLEINYIKQLRPRFNVLMRDDKSFPYILLSRDHEAPQLLKHRGARNRKGDYFGPFASVGAVWRTVDTMQRAFLLRSCTDSYYANRTRPCLQFQIKRCAGPCTGEVSIADYSVLVKEAKDFLSGKSIAVRKRIAAEMQAASDALEFEQAAQYRDRLSALSMIQAKQDINPRETEEADVFAIFEEAGQFIVEVFFFRTFQNWGNRAFYPKADKTLSPEEVLDAFLGQFYGERPAPKLVLLSHAIENSGLLAEALSLKAGHRVEIAVPKRGEKKDLVNHAAKNAREALSRRLSETASQQKLLAALGQAFGLEKAPRRIDVFDNSHTSGTNAVGAMIVAGETGFMKTHYRTFNIKSEEITPGDDFGMMHEVLMRRFSKLQKESPRDGEAISLEASPESESFPLWPDLVLIDGGKGQLDAVRGALAEIGVEGVKLVGIAKGADRDAGRETFFMEGKTPFKLPPREPALYFVQRLRDEAHRFAIGTHRAKRKRELIRNPLDEVPGIGPRRKRTLLMHFGSAKDVAGASLEDLMKTPGVNAATAQAVYDFFHEKQG